MGPMTGRRMGYCGERGGGQRQMPDAAWGDRRWGRGWGRGCRGAGQRFWAGAAADDRMPAVPSATRPELELLREQAAYLTDALEDVQRRMAQHETESAAT